MNFINQNGFSILLGLLIALAGLVAWRFIVLEKRLKYIFQGKGEITEKNLQNDIIRRLMKLEVEAESLEPRVKLLERISQISVQKVGFLRFNPFSDTGGDNSFTVVMLDWKNNGILISSLYTREGVRLYAKQIISGGSRHPLSDEERKVLEETIQNENQA